MHQVEGVNDKVSSSIEVEKNISNFEELFQLDA